MVFADVPTPDSLAIDVFMGALKAVAKVLSDTGRNMLQPAIDGLASSPKDNPISGSLVDKYRFTATIGYSLLAPVAILLYLLFTVKRRPELAVRGLANILRGVAVIALAPLVLYKLYDFIGDFNVALAQTTHLQEALKFGDLSLLDWMMQIILSLYVIPLGIALSVEVYLFYFLGGLALLASPIAIALYGDRDGPFDKWWGRIIGLTMISLFGKTIMLLTLILSSWAIDNVGLQTPNSLVSTVIGLLAFGLAAILPFKAYSGTKDRVRVWLEGGQVSAVQRKPNPLTGSVAGMAAGIIIEHQLDELTATRNDYRKSTGQEPPRSKIDNARVVLASAAAAAAKKTGAHPTVATGLAAASFLTVPKGPAKPPPNGPTPPSTKPRPPWPVPKPPFPPPKPKGNP